MNPIAQNSNPVTVRPVRASDAPAMQAFVRQLAPATRRMRFHAAINGCSPALLRDLTEPDGVHHVAFVALDAACADGAAIVGEARFVRNVGRDSAEFAICVGDAVRGRGVADVLLQQLCSAARAAGIGRLYGDVLADNEPMARFMRRHGFGLAWTLSADASVERWERAVPVPQPARRGWSYWLARWLGARALTSLQV
jgi:acetyltransferase